MVKRNTLNYRQQLHRTHLRQPDAIITECQTLIRQAQATLRASGHVQNLRQDITLMQQAGVDFGSQEIFYLQKAL